MVMADLRDGYISVADAQSVYGQEISADVPHTPPVREAATTVATRGWLSGTNVVGGAAAGWFSCGFCAQSSIHCGGLPQHPPLLLLDALRGRWLCAVPLAPACACGRSKLESGRS